MAGGTSGGIPAVIGSYTDLVLDVDEPTIDVQTESAVIGVDRQAARRASCDRAAHDAGA